ncbi:immunity 50 family protein [Glycomyces sp. A-F 0318]|uniref:Imm50 family immunity protein n=1 Tax=Glycomyces amatae TaxID=2881355 RepID=UPI001E470FC1|nr:Imm50 family immunity protein [Glycomyces amatae]MCD0446317.1 immunity 50 family protein [Glycomyces amatae]
MSWTDLVHETAGLLAVFQGQTPSLEGVTIHHVGVNADGWEVRVRFDLSGFPAGPPAKWVARGSNTAQLDIGLGNLSHLAITGFLGPVDTGRITIGGDRINKVELTVTAGDFRVEAIGEVAMVRSLSAYLRGTSCFD